MMTATTDETPAGSILVVDDVKEQREIAAMMLDQLGYPVSAVSSGEEATEYVTRNMAHLVVLDMIMDPGIDGLETCRRLKADPQLSEVPVLFLSATDRIDDRLAGFEAGAVDFIAKPTARGRIRHLEGGGDARSVARGRQERWPRELMHEACR